MKDDKLGSKYPRDRNPITKGWVIIDKTTGSLVRLGKSKKPYTGIKIKEKGNEV